MTWTGDEDGERQAHVEVVCQQCGENCVKNPALRATLRPLGPETYAQREIVGQVPLPDGSRLILGHREGMSAPFVVSRIGGSLTGSGKYPGTHERALVLLVRELADVAGVVVVEPAAEKPKKPFTPITYAEERDFVDLVTASGNFTDEEID
ncbi:hypothetical protein [Kitasatospora sp. NPDC098663]|uniref:hypothetical protein n=1 Tax=Kitasatospora sp. NPDC098663 TaxID=3364096 RepID=UPI0038174F9F